MFDFVPILADGGGASIGGLIVLLLVAGGYHLYEKFKKAQEEAEFRERMQEEHRRRRAEERAERSVASVPPVSFPTMDSRPQEAPPLPRSMQTPRKKFVPAPVRHAPSPSVVPRHATLEERVSSSMQEDFLAKGSAEAAAAASLANLSDAERAALAALQAGKPMVSAAPMAHQKSARASGTPVPGLNLASVRALRAAVLYKEILDKPVALR